MDKDPEHLRAALAEAHHTTTWGNTTQTVDDWVRIVESGSTDERRRLFEHLFREDYDGRLTHRIFTRDEIAGYMIDLVRPYDRPHLEKKRKVWRSVYLHEHHHVPELAWVGVGNGTRS